MKRFTSKNQKIGRFGEDIVVLYLKKKGFALLERNYTKRFGEIDIITKQYNTIHFIEVKSIQQRNDVSHETYNPAENFTKNKYYKIYKTAMAYLEEQNVSHETRWQIDLYCVYIDFDKKHHKISKIENVVI